MHPGYLAAGILILLWLVCRTILDILILKKGKQATGKIVEMKYFAGRYGPWGWITVRVRFREPKDTREKRIWIVDHHLRMGQYVRVGYWDEWPGRWILVDRVGADALKTVILVPIIALMLALGVRFLGVGVNYSMDDKDLTSVSLMGQVEG